jgi:hypothetical protein
MKYSLCFLAITVLLLSSCKDKLLIGEDQSKTFQKFYGNIFQNNGNDVKSIPVSLAFPNGGYAVAGYTYKDSAGLKADKDMLFIILDRYGNIVGQPKLFGGREDDEAKRVDILPGGAGFILTGYTTVGSRRHAYIVRLNSAGTDTLWTWKSKLWESTAEEAYSLHVDSVAMKYIVVGYQTQSVQQIGWMFDLDDHGVYDSTSSGTKVVLNFKGYNNPNVIFSDIGFISSNSITVYGSYSSPATTGMAALNQSIVFAPSRQGNYVIDYSNSLAVLNQDKSEYPRQMIILPDNSAAFLSSYDSINPSTHLTRTVRLTIFNKPGSPASSGKTSWYYFDDPANGGGGSLDAVKMKYNTAENTFVIITNLTPSNSTSNTSIVLLKIDGTNGTVIWRRTFGINDNYSASSLDLTPDGGYIITGYNNSTGYNQAVLIIKTNLDGFIE